MARSTLDVVHEEVFGARSNGDAIISGLQGSSGDSDTGGALNMDAICVGTLVRRYHSHISNNNVVTTIYHQMSCLTVY